MRTKRIQNEVGKVSYVSRTTPICRHTRVPYFRITMVASGANRRAVVGGRQPRAEPFVSDGLEHTYRYRETAYEGEVDRGGTGKGVRSEVVSKEDGLS